MNVLKKVTEDYERVGIGNSGAGKLIVATVAILVFFMWIISTPGWHVIDTYCAVDVYKRQIYILGLVLAWLEQQGGVEGMQRLKRARAAKVYDFLDNSALFHACAQPGSRSDMNVTFRTGDDALDKEFISGAAARGLLNLKGHRVAGGMRASLYNAMPMAGVDALVDYLKQFEVEHHV